MHGKKDGCLDDVELLLDVAQKIDEFEKDNRYVVLGMRRVCVCVCVCPISIDGIP